MQYVFFEKGIRSVQWGLMGQVWEVWEFSRTFVLKVSSQLLRVICFVMFLLSNFRCFYCDYCNTLLYFLYCKLAYTD